MLAALAFSGSLLSVAVAMIYGHCRSWQHAQSHDLSEQELEFRAEQFRRRVDTSSLLAVVAVALFVGQLIPARQYPSMFVFFWFGLTMVVLWIALRAMGDLASSRSHLAELARQRTIARQQLEAEVSRLKNRTSDGAFGSGLG